ncbi:MAG TPA: patatin-like protein [Ilumatobacteraceae bacterium]|nr:patatin-like protein [Ilumatobacteraceae bacterium]
MLNGSKRELRLALGMRGGVSLAVWIGGACVEIDELRRSATQSDQAADEYGFWAQLTTATGYDSVVVDVMAGASAGGLNGVLLAACQVYGVPFNSIRSTWLDVGSTEKLVRTTSTERACEPAELRWLSLFRGDGHMFRAIVDALTELVDGIDDTQRPGRPPRIDLHLSATHVEPIVRPVRSPADEQLNERRFATGFRFRSPDQPWLPSDFPRYAAPDQAGRAAFVGHVNRLALAARTTSSYPGAFEAASVRSSRQASFASPDPLLIAGIGVDMAGIFADRSVDGSFVVADGGIVDNIPLRRALEAVAAAPAAGPTDRFLVYLHPGTPTASTLDAGGGARTEQRRRSVASVLKATIGAKVLGEDISGDIAAIDDHNRAIDRAVAVRRSKFGALIDRDRLMSSSDDDRLSYLTHRDAEDCRMIRELLSDPVGFLGHDPFPSIAGVDDVRWRSPLADYELQQLDALDEALYDAMASRLPEWRSSGESATGASVFLTGALPVMRVTQALLEWTRHVEATNPAVASAVKQVLYRVLAFCDAGIERPRRLAWVALFSNSHHNSDDTRDIDDMGGLVTSTVASLKSLTQRTADETAALSAALLTGDDGVLADLLNQCLRRVDDMLAATSAGDADGAATTAVDLRYAIAQNVLVPQAEVLRGAGVPRPTQDGTLQPGEYLHRVLAGDTPITMETLAALEIACYPEHATGTPGRRPIDFVRLSAANRTPLARHFTALHADATERGRWWDPATPDWADQQGIHVDLKLAGNELANFSAFLRDEWRANDWMWGRLDAVPTLIDLMVTPAAILRGTGTHQDRLTAIRQMVVGSPDETLDNLGAELWAEHEAAIVDELRAIEDGGSTLEHTRQALVARRQWEILDHELPGDGPVQSRIENYRVGAERITDRQYRAEIRQRLQEIINAASQVLLATTSANGVDRYGTPDKPTLRGRVLRRAVRWAGRFGTGRMIK